MIQIYSGITSGRMLDGELLYTKILGVYLFAFAYRLFHEDFSPIYWFTIHNKSTIHNVLSIENSQCTQI